MREVVMLFLAQTGVSILVGVPRLQKCSDFALNFPRSVIVLARECSAVNQDSFRALKLHWCENLQFGLVRCSCNFYQWLSKI